MLRGQADPGPVTGSRNVLLPNPWRALYVHLRSETRLYGEDGVERKRRLDLRFSEIGLISALGRDSFPS